MYFVYILRSEQFDRRYVGITDNLNRRLQEHNSGKMKSTKAYKPWKIVYHEETLNRIEARKREKYLKSAAGRKFLSEKLVKVK